MNFLKHQPTLVCMFLLLSFDSVWSQMTLCEDQAEELLETSKKLVTDYTRLVETLTFTTEYEDQQLIKEKIFQLTENREIQVEDDLTSYKYEGRRFNLDNYLTNIHYNLEGISNVTYTISNPQNVFFHETNQFYFTLVKAEKVVTRSAGDARYQENFVVKIEQINKNLPILRISDITLIRPDQRIIANPVQTRTCIREIKPLAFEESYIDKYKRENTAPYSIEWQGGILEDSLNIELIRLNKKEEILSVDTLLKNYQNKGYFTQWYLDKKKAGHYKLRMSKVGQGEPAVWSESFRIKRRFPLAYKIGIPVAIIAGGTLYYIYKPEPERTLPEPRPLP